MYTIQWWKSKTQKGFIEEIIREEFESETRTEIEDLARSVFTLLNEKKKKGLKHRKYLFFKNVDDFP